MHRTKLLLGVLLVFISLTFCSCEWAKEKSVYLGEKSCKMMIQKAQAATHTWNTPLEGTIPVNPPTTPIKAPTSIWEAVENGRSW